MVTIETQYKQYIEGIQSLEFTNRYFPSKITKTLSLHPDQWDTGIALIGHVVEFDIEIKPQIGKVYSEKNTHYCARLLLAIPVYSCNHCGKTAVQPDGELWICENCGTEFTLAELNGEVSLIEESWDDIFKEIEENGFSDTASNVKYWLELYYHAPKRKDL